MDQFSAHLDRGWDLVARGDLRGALISARKGLELDADSPEAHNLIGYIQAAEGNAEEALEHYRQAIEADETYIEAMLNAAEVMIHPLHDFEAAVTMIDDALELCHTDDELADTLLLKIDLLLHEGDHEAAARTAEELPEGPFDNRALQFLVGRAKFDVGDVDGAEPLVAAAVEQEPDHGDACYYQGLIREARGDALGATLALLRARELDAHAPVPAWSLSREEFEARVQQAIGQLGAAHAGRLEGALVVVTDLPGPEVVAEGIDPRIPVLVDDMQGGEEQPQVGRVFVYQRNVERLATSPLEVEEQVAYALAQELEALPGPGEPEQG